MSARTHRLGSLILLITSGCLTGAATAPGDMNDGLMLLNATGLRAGPTIDPQFSISSEWGRPALPGIACLMNAVNAMQDLALEDFEEPIVPITYVLESFPEVMIAPETTAPGGAIQTRFIIWGLWISVIAMVERQAFQTVVLTLKYAGVTVGYLKIAQPGAQSSLVGSNETGTVTERAVLMEHRRGLSANTPQGTNGDRFSVSFEPIGPPLPGSNVMLAVLYGLVYAAHFPSTQTADPFDLSLPSPYNMQIQLPPVSAVDAGIATDAPSLEYQWIIKSLSQIPDYMLQRKRFSGVLWRTKIDNKVIGKGQILKKVQQ